MSKLEEIIKSEIADNGPMGIDRFMGLCLGHPQYGYYMTRDPFGVDGDFTTAPEISQMFGELLGAWLIDAWQKIGSPKQFVLLECGAGRGTLMADILRVAKAVPQFLDAANVVLFETSPVLIKKQKETLSAFNVEWIEKFSQLQSSDPLLVIGNELLDALPIQQFQKQDGIMKEKCVGLSVDGVLCFGLQDIPSEISFPLNVKEGDVVEVSPDRHQFIGDICAYIKSHGGIGLFIDYGYDQGHGDTLQAVKAHKFVSCLNDVGNADVTAHVDFMALKRLVREKELQDYSLVTQSHFLKSLGITQRAQALRASPEDVSRLTASDQMGDLFKVMVFSDNLIQLAGVSS